MPSRYFYGPSVKSNRVQASTARDFRKLVYQHMEAGAIRLRITREDYNALSTEGTERLDAKDTNYLMGCTFKEAESERSIANASNCCNLLLLDIDADKVTGAAPAIPFVRSPDILSDKLAPFNFAAYLTASSTPEKPRMRVVVDAEAIPLASYPLAIRTISQMLGLGAEWPGAKESFIPNQAMICPTLFLGQDEDVEHPVIRTGFDGRAFTIADIKDTPVNGKPKLAVSLPADEGDEDGLEYLRAPLMGITLESIQGALDVLSPDMPRKEWMDVACALRHQFSHSDEETEAAFDLFDTWSAKSSEKYRGQDGPDGTIYQWNSVKATPRGRVPVTIRTLIKRASDAGWSAGEVKGECFNAIMDWIAHEAETRYDLTHKALEKVAGLPLLSSTDEDTLLSAIKKQLFDSRKETVTTTSLRKDLKRIQSARDRSKEGAAPIQEQAWTKGWCYVTGDEQFFRHSSHQKMSGEALNSAFGRYMLPTPEQLEKAGKDATEAALNTPLFFPKEYLLHHRQCLVVDGYDYDPAHPKDIYTEDVNGVRMVNIYRQSYPKPDRDTAEAAGKVILNHLANLIAEPEYSLILLDYIAYMVQFPGRKIRWCPLIQGAEGCGKTLMARLLEAVLGEDNVALVNNDGIRSQWNDWAFGAQVIVIPEAYVAGKARVETMNRLKDLVTDDRISVTKRNNSVRTVRNRSNYIMFTNHHDALVLMVGSRRYFIIKSKLQTEEQVKALGDGYFENLFEVIRENAAGLRAFFEDWNISDDFPADGRAPKTKYLEEMIADAADPETSALRRIIRAGDCSLVQHDLVGSVTLKTMMEMEGLRPSPQTLAATLRAENYTAVGKPGGTMIDGQVEHLWIRSGHFLKEKDIGAVARHRYETKYSTAEEEEWI